MSNLVASGYRAGSKL